MVVEDSDAFIRCILIFCWMGQLSIATILLFGIRDIRFDANEGFFLNGERVQIQGVCCHQDHAGVGIAVPTS